MKKRIKAGILAALLCVCFAGAALCEADAYLYSYGGSEDDALGGLAVSEDGQIVMAGYTNSSDGTLATRTKTGRSGWALCIDAQGNVLWSFCTRLGDHDLLRLPVWQADGSVVMVLEAEWLGTGAEEIELIRLDRNGEVAFRKTLEKSDGGEAKYVTLSHVTDEGYVVKRQDAQARSTGSALYGFDGELLRELGPMPDGSVWARSAHHVLRDVDSKRVLFYIDEQGNEVELEAETIPEAGRSRMGSDIDTLISLPDGGAAGVGYAGEYESRKGLIVRWDAQGNRVFEWWMEGETALHSVIKTQGGYAALGERAGTEPNSAANWVLVTFDENGVKRGSVVIGGSGYLSEGPRHLAQLPDGGFVAVKASGNMLPRDVHVVIVPKEAVP